jgi:hypothetical protein
MLGHIFSIGHVGSGSQRRLRLSLFGSCQRPEGEGLSAQKKKEVVNVDKLIEMEWDIIRDLRKMLQDPELSSVEKIRTANALAYHFSVLNKFLVQKGESPVDDVSLGEFIRRTNEGRFAHVEKRAACRVRVDFVRWQRRLSLTG